jgi:hypothetical protein
MLIQSIGVFEKVGKISMIYVTEIVCGFKLEKPIIQPESIGIKNGLSE